MSTPTSVPAAAREAILAWYAEHGRTLAFRTTRDPYAILVSEAMAQQTQAARAASHWERFMERFPTVQALAAATPADVLRAWQGLGYDRRALALWRAARIVVEEHGGRIPSDVTELEALPGVGPYTARAVAAIAFGAPVGAVDVNVRRVLGRIVAGDPASLSTREIQEVADRSVPGGPSRRMDACPDGHRSDALPAADHELRRRARHGRGVASGRSEVVRSASGKRVVREKAAPFTSTNRWLRGRILDRLRSVPNGEWVALDADIGTHDRARVRAAAVAMAADGVLELGPVDGSRATLTARLPLA